ncbi:hypothetical protein AAVH_19480 [Aphelenchoides avenae]|nr:hypothetical protein AAVH_19480 [Aphelenchus avenae]
MPVRNRTDEDFIPASLPPYLPDSFRRQEAAAMTEALPPKYRPESVKSVVKRPLTTDSTFEDGSFVPVHTLAQPARIPLSTTGPVAENVLPSRAPPSTLHGVTMHSRNRYVPSLASADEGFNRAAPPPYLPDSFRRQESIDMAEVLPPKYRVESATSIAKRPLTNESKLGDDSDSPHSPNSENVSVAVNAPAKSEPVQQSFVGQVATLGSASALPASPNSDSVFVPVSVPAKSDSAQVTPFGRDAQRVLPNPITSDNNTATIAQIPSRDVAPSLGQTFSSASLPAYLPDSLRGQENDAGRPPPIYHPKTTQHSANRLVPMESVVENVDSDSTHSSSLPSRHTATNVTAMNGESAHAPKTKAPTSSTEPSTGIRPEHGHNKMHSSNSREPSSPAPRQAAADILPVSSESARALTSSEPISSARSSTGIRPETAHSNMLPPSNPEPAGSDPPNFVNPRQATNSVIPASRRSSHTPAGTAPITLARLGTAIRPEHVHPTIHPSNNPPPAAISQIPSRYVGDVTLSLSQNRASGATLPPYIPDGFSLQENEGGPHPQKCRQETRGAPPVEHIVKMQPT